MNKNHYPALFGIVMVLVLLPFLPAYLKESLHPARAWDEFQAIPTTYAATAPRQIYDYISAGYIGEYGPADISPEAALDPRVLGISTYRISASPPAYQAQETSRSNAVLNLNPGQSITVWVDFLNTGSATWRNNNANFVALNLTNPAGRTSSFWHPYWKKNYRPAILSQASVAPGQTGRFRFALQAPETPGQYQEEFALVAENLAWIDGGYIKFNIGVGESATRPPDFQAEETGRVKGGEIDSPTGKAFTYWVDYKNTGLKTWYNTGDHFIALNVTEPVARVSPFKHDYWREFYYRPARLKQTRVYPGETGRFIFALQAPNVDGYYTEKFGLVAENLTWISGGALTLNFKIGTPPVVPTDTTIVGEPTIRIGLIKSTDPFTITASGGYAVTNMNDLTAVTKVAGETTSLNFSTDAYWRLTPSSSDSIMQVTSWDNKPTWNSTLNDNTFRGTLEVRYSATTQEIWLINELPLESYLRGLAEVSNGQPTEYLKALITAARSYALWHKVNGGKHPTTYFDINATTDQVYRGYGFEQRSTDPVAAVLATSGMVITHPDAVSQNNPQGIAVAAYSSGTDGRTRDWKEVWAGSGFPWLLSVTDPYGILSNWNTLEGNHMVGLSAKGARGYATEEGKTFDWILQHYYTGVSVEKIY